MDSVPSVNPEADIDVEKIKMSNPAWNRKQINNP